MHGLGDNLHLRSILREYWSSGKYDEIQLATSWVSVYWDFIQEGWLKVVFKPTDLRTQTKNAMRELHLFAKPEFDPNASYITKQDVWFRAQDIRERGSVLAAMCAHLDVDIGVGDFRLPINPAWESSYVRSILKLADDRPIMIYRPLIMRTEWDGCAARNPDAQVYAKLYDSVRKDFFVVSVADLVPNVEWIADHEDARPNLALHSGELPIEQLACLFSHAAMVYCSPGFAVIMAQAVETPVTCVFGGYENSRSFSVGAQWAPYLGIDPIKPCQCFQHHHPCDKRIDMPSALGNIKEFARAAAASSKVFA